LSHGPVVQPIPSDSTSSVSSKMSLQAWAWSFYQAARDPYTMLVTVYLFVPYLVTHVIGNPIKGQALVAEAAAIAGWVVAIVAPLLGVMLDKLGRRKPLLGFVTIMMICITASMWWVLPGGNGIPVVIALAMIGTMTVLLGVSDLLHNSLLTRVANPHVVPKASGFAQAMGNVFALLMLIIILWAFVLPTEFKVPGIIPDAPLLGLDPATFEPQRSSVVMVALIFAIGAIPLFLFVKDVPAATVPLWGVIKEAPSALWTMLKSLKGDRDSTTFLISRMIYADGTGAMLIFGGVYAAGVLGWEILELLIYGLTLSLFAAIGSILAGKLDLAVGPRKSVMFELTGCILLLSIQLGLSPTVLFYMPYSGGAVWDGPVFKTLPEILYLVTGWLSAVCVAGAYTSSRTLLTRIAPQDKIASYFGLYALSGTATMWLAPLVIAVVTNHFQSQTAGFGAIMILMIIGLLGLFWVRGGGKLKA
jgi:MFS transporter, UMF1 family